jgi:hypothetical protein
VSSSASIILTESEQGSLGHTLGIGIGLVWEMESSPVSSKRFLINIERSATTRSTSIVAESLLASQIFLEPVDSDILTVVSICRCLDLTEDG